MTRISAGVDVSKNRSTVCIMDQDGKFITKEQTNKQFSCRWGIVFKYGIFYVTYPIQ